MRCIFDSSKHSITLLSFAKLRSDLLAFGNAKGELWLAQPGDEAKAHKVSRQADRQQSCLREPAVATPQQLPMPCTSCITSAPHAMACSAKTSANILTHALCSQYGCANLIR